MKIDITLIISQQSASNVSGTCTTSSRDSELVFRGNARLAAESNDRINGTVMSMRVADSKRHDHSSIIILYTMPFRRVYETDRGGSMGRTFKTTRTGITMLIDDDDVYVMKTFNFNHNITDDSYILL